MVRTQAQSMRYAGCQLTAESLFVSPTPGMLDVITWVVPVGAGILLHIFLSRGEVSPLPAVFLLVPPPFLLPIEQPITHASVVMYFSLP